MSIPKFFEAAVRSSLDSRGVSRNVLIYFTNAYTVRGRPTLKNNPECFWNGLVRELKEKQRKLSRKSMTSTPASKTNGSHRRNNKSEYQECTCKMDRSLNRGMFNKFENRKICVAGYQCDNSDFDFCLGEHNQLPVIKICSDDRYKDTKLQRYKARKIHTLTPLTYELF